VEKSKSHGDFSTVSTALENPSKKKARDFHIPTSAARHVAPGAKNQPRTKPKTKQELSTLLGTGTFYFA
jgi:hypothetical protein